MSVMTNKQFIEKLKHIASLPTTYYSVAAGDWAKWNGRSWNFDCVILIKAVLWGWNENKNAAHGGANYGSNGVYDDSTEQIINRCSNVSSDFSNIEVGELLWMNGHVGIYIGNREVIECTAAWEGKVLYSKIGSNGERTRNGRQVYSWKKHGKLPYLDYIVDPIKTINVIYQTHDKVAHKYWGEVTNFNNHNSEGYAGCIGHAMDGLKVKLSNGAKVYYQAHIKGGTWLPVVSKWDNTDEGYAGIYNRDIDGISMRAEGCTLKYRVHILNGDWLEWVSKMDINDSVNGMAGIYGRTIDAIQIQVI